MTETMIHASRPWSGTPPTGSKERGPKFEKSILNDWSLRCVARSDRASARLMRRRHQRSVR